MHVDKTAKIVAPNTNQKVLCEWRVAVSAIQLAQQSQPGASCQKHLGRALFDLSQ
jgi:hypothetical protein